VQGSQEIENHLSGPDIQISSWLVGQQNRGIAHQSPCENDSLLFPTGQLPRTMPSACSKSYLL